MGAEGVCKLMRHLVEPCRNYLECLSKCDKGRGMGKFAGMGLWGVKQCNGGFVALEPRRANMS